MTRDAYVEMLVEELRRIIKAETDMRGHVPAWAIGLLRILGRIDDVSK